MRERMIALAASGYSRPAIIAELFGADPFADQAIDEPASELGASRRSVERAVRPEAGLTVDAERLDFWREREAEGCWAMTFMDSDYPKALLSVTNPPLVLFGRGDRGCLSDFSIAVVGTRNPSSYGLRCCERLTFTMARQAVTIVSGLALGIDAKAHAAALSAEGRTIAFLPSGIDRIYPGRHAPLAARIVQSGALLTEFAPGTPPMKHHFQLRNRLISGISRGVLVIEAQEKSGTMITARCAAEQGREVFAVPGNIDQPRSRGTNRLIRQGAIAVMSVGHIAEEFPDWPESDGRPAADPFRSAGLTDPEQAVYAMLSDGPKALTDFSAENLVRLAEIRAILMKLELSGRIRSCPGGKYECVDSMSQHGAR